MMELRAKHRTSGVAVNQKSTSKQYCFFTADITEISQRRRIKGFRAAGHKVMSVSFTKEGGQFSEDPDWPNVSLGKAKNSHIFRWLGILFLTLPWLFFHRSRLRDMDVFVARNLDMFCLAWLVRLVCFSRACLVYECLEIHDVFTRPGVVSAMVRWLERRFLARADSLIISSPAILECYFQARQGYQGQWHLVENKRWFDHTPPARPKEATHHNRPLTIGWVGVIRCEPSFRILLETAKRLPKDIRLEIHGAIHRHVIHNFDGRIAGLRNVSYHGTYTDPYDLNAVYERLDLVWAQDLSPNGANWNWRLPSRMYEAAWFGCPSLAQSSTQAGRHIDAHGLGWSLPKVNADNLATLLPSISPSVLLKTKQKIMAMADDKFRLTPQDYQRLSNLFEVKTISSMGRRRAET